ncbi:hypothetical protein FRB94_011456 [Tulasnella sp. JGI-2019a]|nr:hypothetical protein FRB93_013201 [Tulasnella sp. JGI-2019a]KAG9009763.1 hypothetical protein FRB94_011456 [Tulasnella sp. JGI-2019a]
MSASQGAQHSSSTTDFNLDLSNFDLSDFMNSQLQGSSGMEDIFGSGSDGNVSRGNDNGGGSSQMLSQYGGGGHQHQRQHDGSQDGVNTNADAIHQNQQRQLLMHLAAMQTSGQNPAARSGGGQQQAPIQTSQAIVTPESLRQQLQQQFKLQQLQQLQNQILQQQIELITGQNQSQKEVLIHGLLTPTSSSELRPTMNHNDFLSPMTLQAQRQTQYAPNQNLVLDPLISPVMTPAQNNHAQLATMSAPPSFHHQHHIGSGPMDMFSPLTSPALGPTLVEANNGRQPYVQGAWSSSVPNLVASPTGRQQQDANSLELQHHMNVIHQQKRQSNNNHGGGNPNKRPITDDAVTSTRKRPSPLASVTNSPQSVLQQQAAQRKTRSRTGGVRGHQATLSTSGDPQAIHTSSPIDCNTSIDVSMPPPAPPAPSHHPVHNSSSVSSSSSRSASTSTTTSPNLEPVTPASILSLGNRAREPTGLMPSTGGDAMILDPLPLGPMTAQQQLLAEALSRAGMAAEGTNAGSSGASSEDAGKKGKGKTGAGAGARSTKPSPVIKAGTGTPKTILPNGMSVEAAAQLSQKTMMEGRTATTRSRTTNNNGQASTSSPNAPFSAAAVAAANELPKTKTSHKAAEQKRRDSLKAGFNDLRLLLPPIIVDPDSDEALLPGSAPPRGPQRNLNNLPPGSEDHPNRGVSKLALLRCSNEFIARLNRRVDRRDVEIRRLREEILWLRERAGVGPDQEEEGGEGRAWVDLDMDLDEVEREDPNSSNPKARVNGVGVSLLGSPVVPSTADPESKWPPKSRRADGDGEPDGGGG